MAQEMKLQVMCDDDDIDRPAATKFTKSNDAASTTAPQQASCTTASRRHAATCLSWAFLIIAVLLAIAFFITLFVVDNATLHGKYDDIFTPRSVSPYKVWGYTALALTAIAAVLALVKRSLEACAARRCRLLFACAVFIALLASGNILGSYETSARRSYEVEFAAKFNTFYCNARTVRVCLDDDRETLLTLVRGSNATTVQPSENAVDVASSVWSRCQELLMWGIDSTGRRVRTASGKKEVKKGVLAIDTKPLYMFLDDYSSSSAIDVWCGAANRRSSASMSDAEQRALPSPYASHPRVFASYKDEWSRRMLYANAMLGSAVVCMVIAIAAVRVIETSES